MRGGVHIVDSLQEVSDLAQQMCGKFMSFPENERGNICNSVIVNEKLEIKREFFFSLDICRK